MPTLRGSSEPLDIQFLVEGHFASSFSLPFALAPDAIPLRAARLRAAEHVWRGTCGFCVTCKTCLIFWVLLQESISSERMLFKQCALLCQKNVLITKLTSSFWATITWPEVLQSVSSFYVLIHATCGWTWWAYRSMMRPLLPAARCWRGFVKIQPNSPPDFKSSWKID